jgi:hypothetical protein
MVALLITQEVHSLYCSYACSITLPVTDIGLQVLTLFTYCTSRMFTVDSGWQW